MDGGAVDGWRFCGWMEVLWMGGGAVDGRRCCRAELPAVVGGEVTQNRGSCPGPHLVTVLRMETELSERTGVCVCVCVRLAGPRLHTTLRWGPGRAALAAGLLPACLSEELSISCSLTRL